LNDGDRINLYEVPVVFYASETKPAGETDAFIIEPASGSPPNHLRKNSNSGVGIKAMLPGRLPNLIELSQRLGTSLDIEEIFPKVLYILFEMFPQSILGEINLANSDGSLTPLAMKHGREDDSSVVTRVPVGHELAKQVLQLEKPIVRILDASDSESILDEDSSLLCVPMIGPSKTILGTILLESEGEGQNFTEEDLERIAFVGVVAGQAVEYARAHRRLLQFDQTQRQLATAQQIQLRMLPRERPVLPGYEFDARYSAAQTVGGDYFFWDSLSESRVAVAIADSCGKGMAAALMIAQFATQVRHCIAKSRSLKAAMASVNRFVHKLDEGFITFCLCLLDADAQTMTVVNAGHPAPLLLSGQSGVVSNLGIEKSTYPLGLNTEEDFHPVTIPFGSGDQFFLFTDGVNEAMAPDHSLYGLDRLQKTLRAPQLDLTSRLDAVISDVERFRAGRAPSDDSCLVGISCVRR
jgi:serine phosphatase RsbU (regulator of sigma subunit)